MNEFKAVLPGIAADVDHQRAPLELPDKPSIAVLPFINMSPDSEQEYFSDGISEDIITALSKVSKLMDKLPSGIGPINLVGRHAIADRTQTRTS